MRPTIGVVLCTYNGARYVRAQLDSILGQTRKPDVLLAFDDGSQDRTIAELEACIPRASFPLRVVRNGTNLGYARNFEQAIHNCETDIIALSDQDDWWRPDKLERIEAVFDHDARVAAVFSDAEIVDDSLDPLGYRLFDGLYVTKTERALTNSGNVFPVLLRRNIVCGATLALRATWKDRVLPFPDGVVHDEWIALITAAHNSLRFISAPLIRYRQHSANQLGLPRFTRVQRFVNLFQPRRPVVEGMLEHMRELYDRLSGAGGPSNALDEVERKISHLESRLSLSKGRLMRLRSIGKEIANGGYARYSSGWRTVVRDLVSPM
jgi:glycosyltransferase involved in cell wall biosynthesis